MPKTKSKRIKKYTPNNTLLNASKEKQKIANAKDEYVRHYRGIQQALKSGEIDNHDLEATIKAVRRFLSENSDKQVLFARLPFISVDNSYLSNLDFDEMVGILIHSGSLVPFCRQNDGKIYPILNKELAEDAWFSDGYKLPTKRQKIEVKTVIQEKIVFDENKLNKRIEKAKRELKATEFQLEAVEEFIKLILK